MSGKKVDINRSDLKVINVEWDNQENHIIVSDNVMTNSFTAAIRAQSFEMTFNSWHRSYKYENQLNFMLIKDSNLVIDFGFGDGFFGIQPAYNRGNVHEYNFLFQIMDFAR